ncbi:MAG: hypothetical protein LQ350_003172 [Teloschistes chrysophthalmus]|nr:MAG: hypothetical protein LQ350_003172 [Niorma chrysophthalma]
MSSDVGTSASQRQTTFSVVLALQANVRKSEADNVSSADEMAENFDELAAEISRLQLDKGRLQVENMHLQEDNSRLNARQQRQKQALERSNTSIAELRAKNDELQQQLGGSLERESIAAEELKRIQEKWQARRQIIAAGFRELQHSVEQAIQADTVFAEKLKEFKKSMIVSNPWDCTRVLSILENLTRNVKENRYDIPESDQADDTAGLASSKHPEESSTSEIEKVTAAAVGEQEVPDLADSLDAQDDMELPVNHTTQSPPHHWRDARPHISWERAHPSTGWRISNIFESPLPVRMRADNSERLTR